MSSLNKEHRPFCCMLIQGAFTSQFTFNTMHLNVVLSKYLTCKAPYFSFFIHCCLLSSRLLMFQSMFSPEVSNDKQLNRDWAPPRTSDKSIRTLPEASSPLSS